MIDIFWLMKKTFNVTFRKKKNIILYLGMPLIGILIAFMSYGGDTQQNLLVGIVDQDHQQISNDTIQYLKHLDNIKVKNIDKTEVKNKISSGDLDCAIILSTGFSTSILNGKPKNIEILSIKGEVVTGYVKSYLNDYLADLTSLSNTVNGNLKNFQSIYEKFQQSTLKLNTISVTDSSKGKNMTYQTIGFLLMIMLFSAGNFSEIILREKENRTYFRLLSTPIDAKKYVLANVFINMIVMLTQLLFTLFIATKVVHIRLYIPIWQMLFILSIFSLVAVGLSLMIVSFAKSSRSAGVIQNLIVTPSSLLAGCYFPIEIMPKTVQKLANFMPQHWVLDTLSRIQHGSSFISLYLNLMILIAFAIVFFLIATYRFGRNDSIKSFI